AEDSSRTFLRRPRSNDEHLPVGQAEDAVSAKLLWRVPCPGLLSCIDRDHAEPPGKLLSLLAFAVVDLAPIRSENPLVARSQASPARAERDVLHEQVDPVSAPGSIWRNELAHVEPAHVGSPLFAVDPLGPGPLIERRDTQEGAAPIRQGDPVQSTVHDSYW